MLDEKPNVTVSLEEAICYLNSLIEIDRPAMAALIANRVPCNQAFADHPTVQVTQQNDGFHVGLLGILNGMFGADQQGQGYIAFAFSSDGNLLRVLRTPDAITPKSQTELPTIEQIEAAAALLPKPPRPWREIWAEQNPGAGADHADAGYSADGFQEEL